MRDNGIICADERSTQYITNLMPPRSKVRIKDGEISGQILAVTIRENLAVQYLVAWYDGSVRQSEWLESFEVARDDSEPTAFKIGFHCHK